MQKKLTVSETVIKVQKTSPNFSSHFADGFLITGCPDQGAHTVQILFTEDVIEIPEEVTTHNQDDPSQKTTDYTIERIKEKKARITMTYKAARDLQEGLESRFGPIEQKDLKETNDATEK